MDKITSNSQISSAKKISLNIEFLYKDVRAFYQYFYSFIIYSFDNNLKNTILILTTNLLEGYK